VKTTIKLHIQWHILALLFLSLTGCANSILTPPPTPTLHPAAASATAQPHATLIPGAFLTPIPATPTFTPVPTPTPVVHIIEQGDTLFGVVIEYGITLDALLYANGISADDILRIGQVLVIPMEETGEESGSGMVVPVGNMILPTPTPLVLTINDATLYETPAGGLWCMGEVVNTTPNPITNLQVRITLTALDDTPLLSHVTLAAADYLLPDQRAPFAILFDKPPVGTAKAATLLLRGENISAVTAGFVPLDVVQPNGSVSGPQYKVTGLLHNRTEANVTRLTVVVTLYDADTRVIGYRQQVWAEATLGVGQNYDFKILLTPQGLAAPADYQVIAWAVME